MFVDHEFVDRALKKRRRMTPPDDLKMADPTDSRVSFPIEATASRGYECAAAVQRNLEEEQFLACPADTLGSVRVGDVPARRGYGCEQGVWPSATPMAQKPMIEPFMISKRGQAMRVVICLELISNRDGEVLCILARRVSLSKVGSNVVVGGQELKSGMGVEMPRNTEIPFCADITCQRIATCA